MMTEMPACAGTAPRASRVSAWKALALLLCCATPLAMAASTPTTVNFAVNATVVRGCVVSGNPTQASAVPFGAINFGTYPALSTETVTAMAGSSLGSQAKIQCTPGTSVQVSVDGGQNLLAGLRRMSNGAGKFIAYTLDLLQGSATALAPNVPVGIALNETPVALPVRGTVALPGAGVAAGTYVDTVQVTVSW